MTAVPSVSAAALYSIKDVQTRDVLRAIVDGLAVRNGDVGNGDKAFLTRDDLTQAGYTATAVASALARAIATNASAPGSGMLLLADQLEQRIIASPAWQAMFTRLDLIAAPESSVGSAAWSILQEAKARVQSIFEEATARSDGLLAEAKARGAAITTVNQAIQSNAESVARQMTSVTASLNDNAAAIKREETARVTANEASATRMDGLAAGVKNNTALIHTEEQARADAVSAIGTRIDTVAAKVGDNLAMLLTEIKTRADAVSAVSSRIDTIAGYVADNAAGIRNEEQVRVEQDTALAKQINTVSAFVGKNTAAIEREEQARADAVSAVTTQLTTFIAQTANSIAGLVNDITAKTNNDNALVQAINTMWARVGLNTPLIQNGAQIVVNDIGSALTKFEQLQTVTTDPATGLVAKSAALRQDLELASSLITGLNAKWGIKLDLNGYVTGVALNASKGNDGNTTSSFNVLADTFAVGAPGRPNSVPFAIDTLTGLVAIRGDLVVRRSITADALAVNTITANSAVIGNAAIGSAQIQNAAIGRAHIGDASVDTLTLAGNAVTVMTPATGTTSATVVVQTMGGAVFLCGTATASTWDSGGSPCMLNVAINMYMDGMLLKRTRSLLTLGAHTQGDLFATAIHIAYPSGSIYSPTAHTFTFSVESVNAPEGSNSLALVAGKDFTVTGVVLETKR